LVAILLVWSLRGRPVLLPDRRLLWLPGRGVGDHRRMLAQSPLVPGVPRYVGDLTGVSSPAKLHRVSDRYADWLIAACDADTQRRATADHGRFKIDKMGWRVANARG